MGGLIGTSPDGLRAEVRAIGLDEEPLQGDLSAAARSGSRLLFEKVIIPANEICSPSSRKAAACSAVPVKEWRTPRTGLRGCPSCSMTSASQLRQWMTTGSMLAWASSDGGRTIPVDRQTGCGPSIDPGRFHRWQRPGPGRQLDDPGPIIRFSLGDVVGLNSHGRENAMVAARDIDHGRTVRGRGADRDDLDQIRPRVPAQSRLRYRLEDDDPRDGREYRRVPRSWESVASSLVPFPSAREVLVAGPLGASA